MLARGEDNSSERHHTFLADCLANNRECLLADVAIRNKVVRAVYIKFVDFFLRHKFVDLYCALAFNSDGVKLFGLNLNVLTFADFVALDDVGGINLLSGFGIYLAVFDTVAGALVDLIKADFLSLAARGK